MANLIKVTRCMDITKVVDMMVTTEVEEVALTSPIITLITTNAGISVAEEAVAVEDTTAAVTCKMAITSIKAEAVEAWATNSLVVEAEEGISMEEVSTDLKVVMAAYIIVNLMVAMEISCSQTCLNIRKVASMVVTSSILSIKARTCHKTLIRWGWAGHQEVTPIRQLLAEASLVSSNRT